MIGDKFIIDAVSHGYDYAPENRAVTCSEEHYRRLGLFISLRGHQPLESTEPGYAMTPLEFAVRWTPEAIAHALFVESDVDMTVYHPVDIASHCTNGVSRWDIGKGLRDIAPDRVKLYGFVDTFDPDREKVFDQMKAQAEAGVIGFKFYPSNGFFDENRILVVAKYDDPEHAFPYFEHARSLGIKHLAFHKAQPVGPGTVEALKVNDISTAAAAFPDMTFEVVHDGWHFLDECSMQLRIIPNIFANLECTINLIVRQPRRFAEILGRFLLYAGPNRLLYASGCAVAHPEPVLKAFMDFEMPKDLRDDYGFPEVTDEDKAKILGLNFARMHKFDIPTIKEKIKNDKWSKLRAKGKPAPWSEHRRIINSPEYPHKRYKEGDFTKEDYRAFEFGVEL
ncbi:MAG: amidohydrolase family protein [Kordiimonadaceae bacterium]|nr:amidohydrolase family protein [Kordiimonadaceae bacterium]